MGSGVTWVAVAAFVISVASLGWNLWNARPRVSVVLTMWTTVTVGADRASVRCRVVMINRGGAATTVADAGVWPVGPYQRVSADELRSKGQLVAGPELPCRVEGHGGTHWDFEDELTVHFPPGAEIRGFVTQYQPIRWWRRKINRSVWRFIRSETVVRS